MALVAVVLAVFYIAVPPLVHWSAGEHIMSDAFTHCGLRASSVETCQHQAIAFLQNLLVLVRVVLAT